MRSPNDFTRLIGGSRRGCGHDGDLVALGQDFVEQIRRPGAASSDASEAKLSHLHDLRARLHDAGLSRPIWPTPMSWPTSA